LLAFTNRILPGPVQLPPSPDEEEQLGELKSTELPEPAQRQFYLGPFQLVDAHEMFEPHLSKSGAPHVGGDLTFQ
jgi:hypothetical protein